MRLRAATEADVKSLLTVQRACPEAPQWSEAMWQAMFTTPRGILLAENEQDVRGFAVMSVVAGTAELENIAVLESTRRQGVGRALCKDVLAWARAKGAAAVELEVRASNIGAMRLYSALEFCEQGRRLKYYRDPVDDAVLMRVAL